MTYSTQLRGLGATEVHRFSIGQEVTARFTPHGVNASNQAAVFAALSAAMARTGVFKSPTYLGWGSAENAGLVVFKAQTKTDTFTAQQVANKLPAVIAEVTRVLGAARLSFVSLRHATPNGPLVGAAAATPGGSAITPGAPDAAPAAPTADPYAPYAPSSAPVEEPGFFTREVGGVPVWAIGTGVLVLGAGLVFVATRKKKAPAALAANASTLARKAARRSATLLKRMRTWAKWMFGPDLTAKEVDAIIRSKHGREGFLRSTIARRTRRNPPIEFDDETRALAQKVYGR